MSAPTRIDDDLFRQAQIAGQSQGRSAAQQINHWARLGAAVESSAVSHRDLSDVLAGRRPYDSVDGYTQAAVRSVWDEQITERIADLDMAEVLAEDGRSSWVVADPDGTVRHVGPGLSVDDGDDAGPSAVGR